MEGPSEATVHQCVALQRILASHTELKLPFAGTTHRMQMKPSQTEASARTEPKWTATTLWFHLLQEHARIHAVVNIVEVQAEECISLERVGCRSSRFLGTADLQLKDQHITHEHTCSNRACQLRYPVAEDPFVLLTAICNLKLLEISMPRTCATARTRPCFLNSSIQILELMICEAPTGPSWRGFRG